MFFFSKCKDTKKNQTRQKKTLNIFFASFKNVRIFATDLNAHRDDCDALSLLDFNQL